MRRSGPPVQAHIPLKSSPKASSGRQHTGSVLLEFVLAFPIILMLSLAIIQFGFYALLQQTINVATIEGAREAAKVGADHDSIGTLIQQYVAVNSLDMVVVSPATIGSGDILVSIDDGTNALDGTIGNSDITCYPVGPPPTATEIKVTVCVNLTNTDGTFPIPDLLSSFGFSLSGKRLEISAMTVLE